MALGLLSSPNVPSRNFSFTKVAFRRLMFSTIINSLGETWNFSIICGSAGKSAQYPARNIANPIRSRKLFYTAIAGLLPIGDAKHERILRSCAIYKKRTFLILLIYAIAISGRMTTMKSQVKVYFCHRTHPQNRFCELEILGDVACTS